MNSARNQFTSSKDTLSSFLSSMPRWCCISMWLTADARGLKWVLSFVLSTWFFFGCFNFVILSLFSFYCVYHANFIWYKRVCLLFFMRLKKTFYSLFIDNSPLSKCYCTASLSRTVMESPSWEFFQTFSNKRRETGLFCFVFGVCVFGVCVCANSFQRYDTAHSWRCVCIHACLISLNFEP